ncbi:MAG: A/G-specific adenine glycosylase [Bacteroidia bacterium]|nr:A/G-specific adenine glycosylase [Bacteroidia bacterium]
MGDIGGRITAWYAVAGRELPFRETRDPYRIWIAEVVFQQTRISQGLAYYHRFISRFPDVATLAMAPIEDVLKHWEGLGYYSRARNLHAGAGQLMSQYGGVFPLDYREWLTIKGVGPYTARAIGSFAFGNPVGVVDGNVMRVLSRVLGDMTPINQPAARTRFQAVVDTWVQGEDSRAFNHGLMDIGAVICTPTQPGCLICPLESVCLARKEGMVHLLPHKTPKGTRKVRHFNFYLVCDGDAFMIRQRPARGLWGGLWEIPNAESPTPEDWHAQRSPYGGRWRGSLKHSFTHFDMMIHVYEIPAGDAPGDWSGLFINREKIPTFAFAKAVLNIFELTDQQA